MARQRLASQPTVLCQIHATADAGDHLVEAVEQRGQPGCATWHVERKRPAAQRKRERRAACGAEILQDREIARDAAAVQPVDQPPEHVLRPGRHHELVLHQAPPPIQTAAMRRARRVGTCARRALEPSPFPTRSGPEAQLVERAHGGRTQLCPPANAPAPSRGRARSRRPEQCRDPPAGRRAGRA